MWNVQCKPMFLKIGGDVVLVGATKNATMDFKNWFF